MIVKTAEPLRLYGNLCRSFYQYLRSIKNNNTNTSMESPSKYEHSPGAENKYGGKPVQSGRSSPTGMQSGAGKSSSESLFSPLEESLSNFSIGRQLGTGKNPGNPAVQQSGAGNCPSDSLPILPGDIQSTSWQADTRKSHPESLLSSAASQQPGTENEPSESFSISLQVSLPSPPASQQSISQQSGTESGPSESLPSPPTSHSSAGEFGPPSAQPSDSEPLYYLDLPRVFYPFSLCVPRPPTPQALTTYSPSTGLRSPLYHSPEISGKPLVDHQTMVVSCVALETESIGIYFGPNSRHNFSLLLHATPPHNRSRLAAEIFAVHKTLKLARKVANTFGPDRTVLLRIVVVTCADIVVNAVTRWIAELNMKHWDRADELCEGMAENRERLVRLDRLVQDMVDEDELQVLFWLVVPEDVVEAERLAREELRN